MFVIGNILVAVANILEIVINLYTLVIIVSALLSWVNPDPYNVLVRTMRMLTEPVYYRIRKYLPFVYISGLDLSPVLLLLALQFLNMAVVRSIFQLGLSL